MRVQLCCDSYMLVCCEVSVCVCEGWFRELVWYGASCCDTTPHALVMQIQHDAIGHMSSVTYSVLKRTYHNSTILVASDYDAQCGLGSH
jgi:hypothetical protein